MCDEKSQTFFAGTERRQKVVRLRSPDITDEKSGKIDMEPSKAERTDENSQHDSRGITILDPDDALMKRFQNALREHLSRVDNRLSTEIRELETEIKRAERAHEDESLQLYDSQQTISRQRATLERCQMALLRASAARADTDRRASVARESRAAALESLRSARERESALARELDGLVRTRERLVAWEDELTSCRRVAERVGTRDEASRRDLVRRKRERDYVLGRLADECWRLERELAEAREQLDVRAREKADTAQLVVDAGADLEAMHRDHARLCDAWNAVLENVAKRDKVFCDLNAEREKIRESFNALQSEIEKLKKDTTKEMKNNENLTSLHLRIENDIRLVSKNISREREKIDNLEQQSVEIAKYTEETQKMYETINADYQYYLNLEEQINKELAKLTNDKNELETRIFAKLEDKRMYDKAAKYLYKLLLSKKRSIQEQELLSAQAENTYAKNLLELERLKGHISNEKLELDDQLQKNLEKNREIDDLQKKIERCDLTIGRKQSKIVDLNKSIEQATADTGGQDISPQELKIVSLEKNIEETERKNQEAQQSWLRQENFLISLNQQKDAQLQELSRLGKMMMIMEQKNHKLTFELDKFAKEEANMDRKLNLLQQELRQINANLVVQKDLRNELEDKNSISRNVYVKTVQDAEMDLIKFQSDIRELENEKLSLKDELKSLQQESLSWEKKVQLAYETTKKIKDERSMGGDVAAMKSEIHKMEMRLSHLKRAQEKLINDMEYCVARREVILNKAIGKLQKDPKAQHNQKFVFNKRLEDQKLKTKQINKEIRQVESDIKESQDEQKAKVQILDDGQSILRMIEDAIPDLDKEIMELELMKYHNLEVLVFKQRKVKMLQDIKTGQYKTLFKNENVLFDELHNEQMLHRHLKEIMEKTMQDFPLLKNDIRRILLTLQIL